MTDLTPERLAEIEARANMPRLGLSLAREMDKDIAALRDLIAALREAWAEVERLRRNAGALTVLRAGLPNHIEWEAFTRSFDEVKRERDAALADAGLLRPEITEEMVEAAAIALHAAFSDDLDGDPPEVEWALHASELLKAACRGAARDALDAALGVTQ